MAKATAKTVSTKNITLELSQPEAEEVATALGRTAGGNHVYGVFCQLIQHVNYDTKKVTGSLTIER